MNLFMQTAIALATENVRSGAGGPFGAVVVKDGAIIATAANAVTATNDPTAHAEILAVRKACQALNHYQLDGCEIYTSCEPCPMCLGAIYWARPDRVFFGATAEDAAAAGFDDRFIYEELRREPGQRKIPMTPIMREEALAAFRAWRDQTGRIEY